MSSWSNKRRFEYASVVILILLVVVVVPSFLALYQAPTCFDGKNNGDETGVDCGGSCVKLCQSAFLPPKILWGGTKFEKIGKGIYNASSYIENNNIYGAAKNVPYKMSFYDASGLLITDRVGYIKVIPPHRNILAFENMINTKSSIPVKATFEFLLPPTWFKSHDVLDDLSILNKDYVENEGVSSLKVLLENKGLVPYENLNVQVVLYDIENNAVGFSKTTIDRIDSNSKESAVFTWPFDRDGKVVYIEVLTSVEPPHDN